MSYCEAGEYLSVPKILDLVFERSTTLIRRQFTSHIAWLLLLVSVCLSAAAQEGSRQWNECKSKQSSDDLRIKSCTAVLQSNPSALIRVEAHYLRADGYLGKPDYDSAIADYSEGIRLHLRLPARLRRTPPSYAFRGFAYLLKGEDGPAIADFDEAIRLNPREATAYTFRGRAHHFKRDYNRAIVDFNTSISLRPSDYLAYLFRGQTFSELKRHDEAIADFNSATKLNPKLAEAYVDRGIAYSAKGDHERGIADIRQGLTIDPHHREGNIALVLLSKVRYQGVWISKDYGELILHLDQLFDISGDYEFSSAQGQRYGRIAGKVDGDRLNYNWWEGTTRSFSTDNAVAKGDGYMMITDSGKKIEGKWRNAGRSEWDGDWFAYRK